METTLPYFEKIYLISSSVELKGKLITYNLFSSIFLVTSAAVSSFFSLFSTILSNICLISAFLSDFFFSYFFSFLVSSTFASSSFFTFFLIDSFSSWTTILSPSAFFASFHNLNKLLKLSSFSFRAEIIFNICLQFLMWLFFEFWFILRESVSHLIRTRRQLDHNLAGIDVCVVKVLERLLSVLLTFEPHERETTVLTVLELNTYVRNLTRF
jgi:hypothetical protein